VKPGKSNRVDEWLDLLNSHMSDVIQTLDREVQGEGGQSLESSPFEVDARHVEFWNECIDEDYGRHDSQPQVVMVPKAIARAMTWQNPESSAVSFVRNEIIYKRPL
jgi:hypothetical protein